MPSGPPAFFPDVHQHELLSRIHAPLYIGHVRFLHSLFLIVNNRQILCRMRHRCLLDCRILLSLYSKTGHPSKIKGHPAWRCPSLLPQILLLPIPLFSSRRIAPGSPGSTVPLPWSGRLPRPSSSLCRL